MPADEAPSTLEMRRRGAVETNKSRGFFAAERLCDESRPRAKGMIRGGALLKNRRVFKFPSLVRHLPCRVRPHGVLCIGKIARVVRAKKQPGARCHARGESGE